MTPSSFSELMDLGMTELRRGNTLLALHSFEEAAAIEKTPTLLSCLGFCLAKEHGEMKRGRALCLEALEKEPRNALHYLNLGRIYTAANQKPLALQTLRKGLKLQRHPEIIAELKRLGVRRKPVFSFLPREHVLNRLFGRLAHRLRQS